MDVAQAPAKKAKKLRKALKAPDSVSLQPKKLTRLSDPKRTRYGASLKPILTKLNATISLLARGDVHNAATFLKGITDAAIVHRNRFNIEWRYYNGDVDWYELMDGMRETWEKVLLDERISFAELMVMHGWFQAWHSSTDSDPIDGECDGECDGTSDSIFKEYDLERMIPDLDTVESMFEDEELDVIKQASGSGAGAASSAASSAAPAPAPVPAAQRQVLAAIRDALTQSAAAPWFRLKPGCCRLDLDVPVQQVVDENSFNEEMSAVRGAVRCFFADEQPKHRPPTYRFYEGRALVAALGAEAIRRSRKTAKKTVRRTIWTMDVELQPSGGLKIRAWLEEDRFVRDNEGKLTWQRQGCLC